VTRLPPLPLTVRPLTQALPIRWKIRPTRYAGCPLAAEDVARVAATFLAAPEPREPGPVRLVGQVATVSEIVTAFSRAAGRDLRYADVPSAAWKRTAIASGINPHAAEHLAGLWDIFRAGGAAARQLHATHRRPSPATPSARPGY
jgi:uncharacterized protein YbjT (DUF2867 family)